MGCASSTNNVIQSPILTKKTTTKKNDSEIRQDSEEKIQLYERANYLINNSKFQQAEKLIERILSIDPTFIDAHYSKGIIQVELQLNEEAENSFTIVLDQEPNHLLALNELSSLYIKQKKIDAAKELLQRALKLDPSFSEINYSMGYVQSRLNNNQEALNYYNVAIEKDPLQKHYYVNKAVALMKLKEFNQASECIQKSLLIDQNYIDGLLTLGNIYYLQNKFDKLYEVCDKVLFLDSENKQAASNKQKAELKLSLQQQTESKGNVLNDQLQQATNLYKQHKYSEAISLLNQVLQQDPIKSDALLQRGKTYLKLQQFNEASKDFDPLLKIKGILVKALKGKAKAMEGLGNYEEAILCYDTIIKSDSNLKWFDKKINIYTKLNKQEEIVKVYEDMQKSIDKNNPKYYLMKYKILNNEKKELEGLKILQEGIIKYKNDIDILYSLALQYKLLNQNEESLQIYNQLIKLNDNQKYIYEKGILLYQLNQYQNCLDILFSLKNYNIDINVNYFIGSSYFKLNKFKQSIPYFNEYLEIGQDYKKETFLMLGQVYENQLQIDLAIENYLNYTKIVENDASIFFKIAELYTNDKDIEQAKKYYQQAIKLNSQIDEYKEKYDKLIINEKILNDYKNGLLYALVPFIGLCQVNPKQPQKEYVSQFSNKYLALLLLLEDQLNKRFNSIDNHFQIIRDLISQSYDMKYSVIDDVLFPTIQYWYVNKICIKKRENIDFVKRMIQIVNILIDNTKERIISNAQKQNQERNKFCRDIAKKLSKENWQSEAGKFGLEDGIIILAYILRYQKELLAEKILFQDLIVNKFKSNEFDQFHDSYYKK